MSCVEMACSLSHGELCLSDPALFWQIDVYESVRSALNHDSRVVPVMGTKSVVASRLLVKEQMDVRGVICSHSINT